MVRVFVEQLRGMETTPFQYAPLKEAA